LLAAKTGESFRVSSAALLNFIWAASNFFVVPQFEEPFSSPGVYAWGMKGGNLKSPINGKNLAINLGHHQFFAWFAISMELNLQILTK
jgi:hypothetical protein